MVNVITCFLVIALHHKTSAFSYGRISRQPLSIIQPNHDGVIYRSTSINNRCSYNKRAQLVIFNSLNGSNDNVNGNVNGSGKPPSPQKWRKLSQKLNPIPVVLKFYTQINKAQSNFRVKFQSLSKKGKLVVSMQLLALMLIFGSATNQVISSVRSQNNGNMMKMERSKPVEVPYSVFMDMVEKSGKVRSCQCRNKNNIQ